MTEQGLNPALRQIYLPDGDDGVLGVWWGVGGRGAGAVGRAGRELEK